MTSAQEASVGQAEMMSLRPHSARERTEEKITRDTAGTRARGATNEEGRHAPPKGWAPPREGLEGPVSPLCF